MVNVIPIVDGTVVDRLHKVLRGLYLRVAIEIEGVGLADHTDGECLGSRRRGARGARRCDSDHHRLRRHRHLDCHDLGSTGDEQKHCHYQGRKDDLPLMQHLSISSLGVEYNTTRAGGQPLGGIYSISQQAT